MNEALGDAPRLPDFVSVNGGFMTGGLNFTLEAHGNLYGGFEIFPRKPVNEGATNVRGFMKLTGSVSLGWLDQFETPSEAQANNFLTGPFTNASFGSHGAGVGRTWSPGNGTATNIGVFTPGPSFSGGSAVSLGQVPRFRWRN